MFHIMYDLESRFATLDAAVEFTKILTVLNPYIPHTHASDENVQLPRVCVAPTVEDCITSIGASGRFRRCVHESYDNANEIYPCIVCEVTGKFFRPTQEQVPDIEMTQEHWSLGPVTVVSAELRWLGYKSVKADKYTDRVFEVQFVADIKGFDHPWITGRGHPLDCSYLGSAPWPPIKPVMDTLYLETFVGNSLVSIVPQFPPSGYCTCYPATGAQPYRARIENCRRFTGYFDDVGAPLFVEDFCETAEAICNVVQLAGGVFGVRRNGTNKYIEFIKLGLAGLKVEGIHSLEHHSFERPQWFKASNSKEGLAQMHLS